MADDPMVFLERTLSVVEERAKAAAESDGEVWDYNDDPSSSHRIVGASSRHVIVYDEGVPDDLQAEHIAAFDPASVLRMVTSTRELLKIHLPYLRYVGMDKSRWVLVHGAEAVDMARRVDEIWKTDGLECEACGDFEGLGEHPRLPWPCPSVKAVAGMWGWTGE